MGVKMNLSPVQGDGANLVFLLGNNADLDHLGTPVIYVAGAAKTETTDYSISGYEVTFVVAPASGEIVQGDYSALDRN